MADEIVDPKRAKKILDLQSEAAKEGIPCMVFVDEDHMSLAQKNMKLGAAVMGKFIYIPCYPMFLH